jgi:hypothetical protein
MLRHTIHTYHSAMLVKHLAYRLPLSFHALLDLLELNSSLCHYTTRFHYSTTGTVLIKRARGKWYLSRIRAACSSESRLTSRNAVFTLLSPTCSAPTAASFLYNSLIGCIRGTYRLYPLRLPVTVTCSGGFERKSQETVRHLIRTPASGLWGPCRTRCPT